MLCCCARVVRKSRGGVTFEVSYVGPLGAKTRSNLVDRRDSYKNRILKGTILYPFAFSGLTSVI